MAQGHAGVSVDLVETVVSTVIKQSRLTFPWLRLLCPTILCSIFAEKTE